MGSCVSESYSKWTPKFWRKTRVRIPGCPRVRPPQYIDQDIPNLYLQQRAVEASWIDGIEILEKTELRRSNYRLISHCSFLDNGSNLKGKSRSRGTPVNFYTRTSVMHLACKRTEIWPVASLKSVLKILVKWCRFLAFQYDIIHAM